tara:strand:+ start:6146 stop:7120 length:975 start_codon:yes stop_codon:yes gene_type:complete
MRLLITGGAGYIGSHIVLAALDRGYKVTVFDDLSTGLKRNINKFAKFVKGSTCHKTDLFNLFKNNRYDGVIHLAASKAAGDSMLRPSKYAENNIIGGINLINACFENNISVFVFSSSASVYGKPKYTPLDENHSLNPDNYYGYSKLVIENNLKWFSKLKGINYAALRYFNAAGYDIEKRICGIEANPQNLLPIVMDTAMGFRPRVNIFGNNYNTEDGTGIRDYVHVSDLAIAHINAIDYIVKEKKDLIINLGSGIGYSVLEIINKATKIINKTIKYKFENRRLGDSDRIVAKTTLAKKLINWEPKYSDLNTIIDSMWQVYKSKT